MGDKKELSPSMENDLSFYHFWATLFVECKSLTRFSRIWYLSPQRYFCHLRHLDGHHEEWMGWIGPFHHLLNCPCPRSFGESGIEKFIKLWSKYGSVGSIGRYIRRLEVEGTAVFSFSSVAPYQCCSQCVIFRLSGFWPSH